MPQMILKMTTVTAIYIILTIILWYITKDRKLTNGWVFGVGIFYGICSILSTHFGINYNGLYMLNVRDMGPLAAGFFFHPVSGIIAGLIGGIERYIAGTYWGIGSYTSVACGISTALAGFVSAALSIVIFKREKPLFNSALFMGFVTEVFHMYVILITHREDMDMAFQIVRTCSMPMILFTGFGLGIISLVLQKLEGNWHNAILHKNKSKTHVSDRFRFWLFIAMAVIFAINFLIAFGIQSQAAIQEAREDLTYKALNVQGTWQVIQETGIDIEMIYYTEEGEGTFDILKKDGVILEGNHKAFSLPDDLTKTIVNNPDGSFFQANIFNRKSLCRTDDLGDDLLLLTMQPMDEVYEDRNIHALETAYADILLITFVYVLISYLVQKIVVDDLETVNKSLEKITMGDLNEIVNVRNSSEFSSLSDDINETVNALKGYIDAAEHRMEEELRLARIIQESALPKNFNLQRDDIELYASMNPAKQVGGDFYDFFLIGKNMLGLVIADVSGKGIPAALFMMRSKALIRSGAESTKSPAEIFSKVNKALCEGNDADMFVTVWMGILNLDTGLMQCANAGHEYPALMRAGEPFELYKDKHTLFLGGMSEVKFHEYELQLNRGDRLFVYTDGIPEANNDEVELYGPERMIKALNHNRDKSIEQMLAGVSEDMSHFVGNADQFDDITMLGLQYNGPDHKAVSIHIPAAVENLHQVLEFVDTNLETAGCPSRIQMQINVAVEELFVNIANYAYTPGIGDVKITLEIHDDPRRVKIIMKDTGMPFNPLEKEDPDITLSAEEREIGGLGIFMAKKYFDDIQYHRENGKNVLTLWKKI